MPSKQITSAAAATAGSALKNPASQPKSISNNMRIGMELMKKQTETGINLTEQQKLDVIEMLKEFKHFSGLSRQENCIDYLSAAIPFFKYHHVKRRDFVFHHSDRGGIFFFIMKGTASVFVPKSQEELDREVLLNNSHTRLLKQIASVIAELEHQFKKKNNPNNNGSSNQTSKNTFSSNSGAHDPESLKNLQTIARNIAADIAAIKIKGNEELLSKQMFRYTTHNGLVCTFKQVNQLSSSDSFGEVSIVTNNKLRTASVVAAGNQSFSLRPSRKNSGHSNSSKTQTKEDSIAYEKEDYIITELTEQLAAGVEEVEEEKKVEDDEDDEDEEGLHLLSIAGTDYIKVFDQELNKMNFTLKVLEQTFPLSSRDAVVRLAYEFKELLLDKGQFIFTENTLSKHVYLIKSGEVELIKRKEPLQQFDDANSDKSLGILPVMRLMKRSSSANSTPKKQQPSNPSNNNHHNNSNSSTNLVPITTNKLSAYMTFALLGSEAFFGMEDLKIHSFAARSASANTVVFAIHRSLMEDAGMLRMIRKKITDKRGFYQQRIAKLNEFAREQSAEKRKPHVISMKDIMKANGTIAINPSSNDHHDPYNDPYQMKSRQTQSHHTHQTQLQHHPPPPLQPTSSQSQTPPPKHLTNQQQQSPTRLDLSAERQASSETQHQKATSPLNSVPIGVTSASSTGSTTPAPTVVPRIQFKRVMKDFLEAKKVSSVVGYFLAEQVSVSFTGQPITPGSQVIALKAPKHIVRIGREQETVNESEQRKLNQVSSYNQQLLDTKTEQQNQRMWEYLQEEEVKRAKAKKASKLRTTRPQYIDYLHASHSSHQLSGIAATAATTGNSSSAHSLSPSQKIKAIQKKLQVQVQPISPLELPIVIASTNPASARATHSQISNTNPENQPGCILPILHPYSATTASLTQSPCSLQYQLYDKEYQVKLKNEGLSLWNRQSRVRSDWLQGISMQEQDRESLNQIAQKHLLLTRGRIPLKMKRQPNLSKLDEQKTKRVFVFQDGKIVSVQDRLLASIPVQQSLPILHSYFNKSQN